MKYLQLLLIISLTSCITNDNSSTQHLDTEKTGLSKSTYNKSVPEPFNNNFQYPDWYHIRDLVIDNNKQVEITALIQNDQIINVYAKSLDDVTLKKYSWLNNNLVNNEREYTLKLEFSVPRGICCIQFPPDSSNGTETHPIIPKNTSNLKYIEQIKFTESHPNSHSNNGQPCINGICPQ